MKLKIIVWLITAVILSSLGRFEDAVAVPASRTPDIPHIYFAESSIKLSMLSKKNLDRHIRFLKDNPDQIAELIGHKDLNECKDNSSPLALRRAMSVKSYLIENGIPADHLIVKGAGCREPIAPSTNPDGTANLAGLQQNRRVEFKILEE